MSFWSRSIPVCGPRHSLSNTPLISFKICERLAIYSCYFGELIGQITFAFHTLPVFRVKHKALRCDEFLRSPCSFKPYGRCEGTSQTVIAVSFNLPIHVCEICNTNWTFLILLPYRVNGFRKPTAACLVYAAGICPEVGDIKRASDTTYFNDLAKT